MMRQRASSKAFVTALMLHSTMAIAQLYPVKSIRLIVPFAAGGSSDTLARTLGQALSESFGQQVVVDNRPGAGGNIGMELAAKASPDGYTMVLADVANLAISPTLYAKLPYDPVRDYSPVNMPATSPNVMLVHPSVPATTLKELLTLAKEKPRKITYASAGVGQVGHLTGEMLNQLAGVEMVHVPYKGSSQAVIDLVGGHIQVMFSAFSSTLPHIKAGRLRALAVTSRTRSAAVPDVPTIAESGFPGFEAVTWYSVVAPARTPRDAIERLNGEILQALGAAQVKERLSVLGFEIVGSPPDVLAAYIKSEIVKWAPVVKASGAKVD
jgi:tripartite-type tricarboxylate transporter receptor subunit TctC